MRFIAAFSQSMKSGMRAEVHGQELLVFRFPGIVVSVVKVEFQANSGNRSIYEFALGKFA